MMSGKTASSDPVFISIESGDSCHIVNLNCVNSIQVNSVNGELRSAAITLNDDKNVISVIGGQSLEQLLDFLKPHIELNIQSRTENRLL